MQLSSLQQVSFKQTFSFQKHPQQDALYTQTSNTVVSTLVKLLLSILEFPGSILTAHSQDGSDNCFCHPYERSRLYSWSQVSVRSTSSHQEHLEEKEEENKEINYCMPLYV